MSAAHRPGPAQAVRAATAAPRALPARLPAWLPAWVTTWQTPWLSRWHAARPAARLGALLLACPLASHAAAASDGPTVGAPLWELGLGAALLRLPHYRGADQQHTWLLPLPYLVYRGAIFKADRDGARAELYDEGRVKLDLSVAASAPTRSRDNQARSGMADLAPTLELGPNLVWALPRGPGWALDLRLPVRTVVTVAGRPQALGWMASPHLNVDLSLGAGPGHGADAGWRLGLLAGPVFGSRGVHGYFYDVPAALATASRPAYRAAGGFAGLSATAALSRRQGAQWLGAFVKFDQLDGAAFAHSPLVRQRQQWSGGVALSWVLAESTRRVGGP